MDGDISAFPLSTDADHKTVVLAHAALARQRSPAHLVGPALRTRSLAVREVFARVACGSEIGYDQLTDAMDETAAPLVSALSTREHRRWLLALAYVMAAQDLDAMDRSRALILFDTMFDRFGADPFDADHQTVYAQLLFLSGRHTRCAYALSALTKVPAVIAHYLRCDLASPFGAQAAGGEEPWLPLVNAPLVEAGLEPLRLHEEDIGPPFDRLTSSGQDSNGSVLVSVIMSAYRPDRSLLTSVRSILSQTWTNLELIIVDDASGPDFHHLFDVCRDLDPRVRVIRQHVNGGTYVARNAGLDAARGAFIAFQDSDDWSHPRRIERQMAPLLADPSILATRSLAVRAHNDLTHQWLGYPAQRVNASSLLLRREPVLTKLGYFDSIRKGADAEYAFRLEASFGPRIHDVREPLAYTRLRQTSLSRSDFALGWSAPARIAHQAAYRQWHRGLVEGESPYLPRHPWRRPFPVPLAFLDRVPGSPVTQRHYDVVFLDDWRPHTGPVEGGLEEIATLTERGLSVGLTHLEAIGQMTASRQHVDQRAQEVVNAGQVDRVMLDDNASVSLLIVREPALLQFPPAERAALDIDRALIVASRSPSDYPSLSLAYDTTTCTANARVMFGVDPNWMVVHEALRGSIAADEIISPPVDTDRWATDRSPHRQLRRPIVGRYDADTSIAWPNDPAVVRQVYPQAGDVDIRVLGQVGQALRVLGRTTTPPAWLVYDRGQLSLRAYLHQIDFFVYFPSHDLTFPPIDLVARAMASGRVVLVPERFRPVFEDAAVYCSPETIMKTVRRYHTETELYRRQVERAYAFVARRHAPDDYGRRIEELTEPRRA